MAVSWIVDAVESGQREKAMAEANHQLVARALGQPLTLSNEADLAFTAEVFALAVGDALTTEGQNEELRKVASSAFQLLRVLSPPTAPIEAAEWQLRIACLGILADRPTDSARLLVDGPLPELPVEDPDWGTRVRSCILDAWIRLIRKNGWDDLKVAQTRIGDLRQLQAAFEARYLESAPSASGAAWELAAFYHLSKAVDILAVYTTQGAYEGRYDIDQQLEAVFDRAISACSHAELVQLENLTRLLAATAKQLVGNSIWTVTRAVNSRVTDFVNHLVKHRTLFEMLPPQRRALHEQGLLGSGWRSVVVSLPTSSGKTMIAEFRILQALNQFEREKGWVAYLVPTRALVNQVCAQMRADFQPLGISVERVSPALEVDGLEQQLLTDRDEKTRFRILVTTPEKLDLLMRAGWEDRIGRPITLVVVDEAHNIASTSRGIRLELLLATINRECRHAQFLLLTPFVPNATELSRWLDPRSSQDINIGVDWQASDRLIALATPKKVDGRRGHYTIELSTVHTSKRTIDVSASIPIGKGKVLGMPWSNISGHFMHTAAATAHLLEQRGPSIVLVQKPSQTWTAAKLMASPNGSRPPSEEVKLVQRFLAEEFGQDFALVDLIGSGIGVHHSGLSDETRALMEWLLVKQHLIHLVATTTIAQGINFPVCNVVMASHQYPTAHGPIDMPPEDFWNLAGRVGRVGQGSLGIVALACDDDERARVLRAFINQNVQELNSTLVKMVRDTIQSGKALELHQLSSDPEWSAFVQYLAHTYRQIGDHERFAAEIEQILRGTLGFQELRRANTRFAGWLVDRVQTYAGKISGKALKLVDLTGFSWETVSNTLRRLSERRISESVWDANRLFTRGDQRLPEMMGILLEVPELRSSLSAVTERIPLGRDMLANIVSDWVNGATLPELAKEYFSVTKAGKTVDRTTALTDCCYNLFSRIIPTTSWGLSALQTLTFGDAFDSLPEDQQRSLRNLPGRVFYGVSTDDAIALRLLGVPRRAARRLAERNELKVAQRSVSNIRDELKNDQAWLSAMGRPGLDYASVWRILERTA